MQTREQLEVSARDVLALVLVITTGQAHEQVQQLTDKELQAIVAAPKQPDPRQAVKDVCSAAYDRRRLLAQAQAKHRFARQRTAMNSEVQNPPPATAVVDRPSPPAAVEAPTLAQQQIADTAKAMAAGAMAVSPLAQTNLLEQTSPPVASSAAPSAAPPPTVVQAPTPEQPAPAPPAAAVAPGETIPPPGETIAAAGETPQ